MKNSAVSIFWFRRDLRLHDNTGLYHALKEATALVLPLFIFDNDILDELEDRKDPRVNFILQELGKIHSELARLHSSLLIRKGTVLKIFKDLFSEYEISQVYTNHDYEPYAIKRDEQVKNLLQKQGISFHTFKDQVIFEKQEIVSDTGSPYKVYTAYKNKWLSRFNTLKIDKQDSEKYSANLYKTSPFPLPSIKEIGFEKAIAIGFPSNLLDEKQIATYDKSRDFPQEKSTSRLGIHLRFGTISIRNMVKKAERLNETWLKELIWREFFMQLLFNFPYVENESFNPRFKKMKWRHDEKDFEKWCEGKTGYPMVDAGIRELNATGFMHNRVRMVAASFLSKHLLIDWRWGEAYFAKKLLDYELASNNGNWQWAAGTGADAQPFFRIFNPVTQQEKFDPDLIYIKKWIPEFETSAYPKPMVDHKTAVDRAKKAFADLSN